MRLDASLRQQLAALTEEEGLKLLAADILGGGAKTILRLTVDGPQGVTLDQCAGISRQASVMLDVEDPFSHRYTLEVSSPGLDRRFYAREDYQRYTGRRVKMRMQPTYRERRVLVGELLGPESENVKVRLDSQETVSVPLNEVFETRIEVDWKALMKEGKHRQ